MMTIINHKTEEVVEERVNNKGKYKFGLTCLLLGLIIGYRKGYGEGANRIIITTKENLKHF